MAKCRFFIRSVVRSVGCFVGCFVGLLVGLSISLLVSLYVGRSFRLKYAFLWTQLISPGGIEEEFISLMFNCAILF